MCHRRVSKKRERARAGGKAPSSVASRHCRHAGGKRLLRRQHSETAPARHKGPDKTSNKASATRNHPLCARRARRAALCQRARAARGKGAENGTKGTCAEQRAGRGGQLLGQERRMDQARGARSASRSQRRGTISPGRAVGGSAEAFDCSSWRTLTS